MTVGHFVSPSSSVDTSPLAEGLTDAIVVGLSRFSYLRVVKQNPSGSPAAGYLLQGSVRTAGRITRVVAQLSDVRSGTSLWAATYDRGVTDHGVFDLQDEIAEKIVVTIADVNGALVRAMTAVVRQKPARMLTPYEAVLRRLAYENSKSPAEHAQVREALEQAVQNAPAYADGWASLAFMYAEEYAQSFNMRPDPLERARTAARRALEIDSSNHLAYMALARTEYFSRDTSAFRAAADHAIALNPLDTDALAYRDRHDLFGGVERRPRAQSAGHGP